jgi:hypothetical protein
MGKTTKLLLPLAAAACAVGLATAAPAYADEQSYFEALTDYGYGDTSQDVALDLGYSVCQDAENGVPKSTTIQAIYDTTNENVDAADAEFLYKAAILHLC